MSGYRDDGGFGADAAEQGRRNYEQSRENSIDSIASFASVQEEDGKYRWMGIEVSRNSALLLKHATSGLPALIAEKLNGGAYDFASSLHDRMSKEFGKGLNETASHSFGLKAAAAATALVVGLQPIMTGIQAVKNKMAEDSEVRKDLKAIIETSKNYKDNEIYKTAMEHGHKMMVAGFKEARDQLPTVIANAYFARGNHKQLAAEKFAEVKGVPFDRENHSFKIDETTQKFVGMGSLLGNILLSERSSKKSEEDLSKPNAYKMIVELQRQINNGDIYKGTDLTNHIIEIFQQNERDRGRPAIGPALMDKFSPLAKKIAEVISTRELDASALVNLVGDGKVVNKRRFIKTEHLEELIKKEEKVLGSRDKTPLDDLLSNFQDPKAVMGAIKETLKTLEGDSKAMFASLFSDDVLLNADLKKKEISALRVQGQDSYVDFIKSRVTDLATKAPEELKAKGLSEKEIEEIRQLNEYINNKDEKAAKSAIISTDNGVVSAVRTAGLYDQVNGDKMYWTKVIPSKKTQVLTEKPVTMTEAVKSGRENGTSLGVV